MYKRITMVFCVFITTSVVADEPIYFNDGSMAWRGQNGQIWGKTPSPRSSAPAFSPPSQNRTPVFDNRGQIYTPAGPNGLIDPRTGQFIPTR